jgi:hypothetical protein
MKKAMIGKIAINLKGFFMMKNLLNWLASSTSLVAMLLIMNPANAVPVQSPTEVSIIAAPGIQEINLSLASPALHLTTPQNNSLFSHLAGCTCAGCTRASTQTPL